MKTSNYSEDDAPLAYGDGLVSPGEVEVRTVEVHRALDIRSPDSGADERNVNDTDSVPRSQFVSAEDLSIQRMETQRQKWRESQASLASSEVSVQRDAPQEERWSDTQTSPPSSDASAARDSSRAERWSDCRASPPALAEDAPCELYYTASSEVSLVSEPERAEREEGVMAGHVAAMRERFESMTRANTPCPDSARAPSPALDLLRSSITPSPDLLG